MTRKSCPFFNCTNVTKHGLQNGRQRYRCVACSRTWTSIRRPGRRLNVLWHKYAFDGRSVRSLACEYKASEGSIRSRLHAYTPTLITQVPRTVAVIIDVTYFGSWGILVVIDPYAKQKEGENTVLYYAVVEGTERTIDYEISTDTIEAMGYSIIAVTIDGRRGVRNMLEARGIPVQHCQFHQLMTITQCLTKKPRLTQNIELRAIALTLSQTDEPTFEDALAGWYGKHGKWLKQKDPVTKRWAHERTRRAYFSLVRNLPYLFTYQADYLQEYACQTGKKIANTTSPLDGRFGVWKDKLIKHRRASKQLTFTMLCSLFSEDTGVKKH
ncbi:hypothetical protein IPL85_01910 [Candidatus Saccharibacteria bacterium]|nr:MAG: hypothetical protein IPL85_01910 [Candidatus Saccharibacteria bacterium]